MSDAPRPGEPVVLVVDDEAWILSALRRTLRRAGFAVVTAESAREALRLLEESDVDIVLSDHKMPGMGGMDLLAAVARRWPHLPRFLITGWPEEVPPERQRALGIRALVPKPWDDAALKALLRAARAPGAGRHATSG